MGDVATGIDSIYKAANWISTAHCIRGQYPVVDFSTILLTSRSHPHTQWLLAAMRVGGRV